jgi:acetylornithine deacetylase
MKKMFFNNIYKPSYSTFNIGIINGGESINVVPSFCNLKFDFRPVNQEAENFMFRKLNIYLLKLEKKENCSIEIKKLCEIPPLFNKKISKNKCFPATTEGGYYDKIGISTIICGPGSIKLAHKENEFVTTKQLEMCLEFLEKL